MSRTPVFAAWAASRAARVCVDCEQPIPPKRLVAVPDADRCVPCQAVIDEPLVASPVHSRNEEEVDAADFAIVRKRHRDSDIAVRRSFTAKP